jgi:predicted DNA-binding transcriptional regulator YafY
MRADRLLSLLVLLQNHPCITAGELAERLGVSIRTVQRDVDALSGAGVPVYAERGRGGGLRLHGSYTTRLTGLSQAEAEALALVSTPSLLADLSIERDFASAVEKIAAAIPAVHRLRARHARHRLMFDAVPWFRQAAPDAAVQRLEELRQAVWRDVVCHLDYQRGDGARKRYRVEPYALVAKVDVWYLVARAGANSGKGMRVFRLSRIVELEVTDGAFERDPDFDLARFWKRWCRRFETRPADPYWVTLALTPAGRDQLLERYGSWHASALAAWPQHGERHVVTLDLEREDIAARVVFDLAGAGQVLQPMALRQLIRQRADAVLHAVAPVEGGRAVSAPT